MTSGFPVQLLASAPGKHIFGRRMTDVFGHLGAALAEIKTTARLQHPHILPLLDSGSTPAAAQHGGLLYYVMPYVDGESLRQRLVRETQLPIEDAVRLAREVADALESAHAHGIVHRDSKPENILGIRP